MGRDTEQKVEDRGGEGKRRERKTSRVWVQRSIKKSCGYRKVTERCGYREVPLGGCGKELEADGGWDGLGTASFEFHAQSYPGLPGDPKISPSPLPLSVQTVKASMKGPKGSPLSDTQVFYRVPDSEANEEKRCRSHRDLHTSPAAIVTRLIGLCGVIDS